MFDPYDKTPEEALRCAIIEGVDPLAVSSVEREVEWVNQGSLACIAMPDGRYAEIGLDGRSAISALIGSGYDLVDTKENRSYSSRNVMAHLVENYSSVQHQDGQWTVTCTDEQVTGAMQELAKLGVTIHPYLTAD